MEPNLVKIINTQCIKYLNNTLVKIIKANNGGLWHNILTHIVALIS